MEGLLGNVEQWINNAPLLAFVGVFIGGVISSLSPCVLALIPLSIGYVGGYAEGSTKKAIIYSLMFVLGLTITFVVLGGIAAYVGGMFGLQGKVWYFILAGAAFLVGLNLVGLLKFELPWLKKIKVRKTGLWGALLFGLVFGIASSPCAAPILALILAFAATTKNVVYGMGLLLTYSIGHWILIFAAGVSTAFAQKLISSEKTEKVNRIVKLVAGILLFGVGLYFVYLGV
ncbi:cytochrome c biogenesis protein CcdA [candidate division WOR-3 bacterium]|uniref:Cytochrome c biogenesis protein CcdA n=1 Tax=candidate division WOR-3 bacterium TaxID=2052148 RepID=A0A9D5KA02_UNCW3|nr:cytochrome c biogenesis protein CcdA [candidate division WOR-3 bacterium]MBD3365223.1 cytochrome c biogenesis protein CcdA [candidate division WOR-3 bacterium]